MAIETATIADGTSLSGSVQLFDRHFDNGHIAPVAIITPSGWTTAAITFQASTDGTTWYNLYNTSGTEVQVSSVAASLWVSLDPKDFVGIPYIKVRSGTSGAAVNQAGGDIVTIVTRRL